MCTSIHINFIVLNSNYLQPKNFHRGLPPPQKKKPTEGLRVTPEPSPILMLVVPAFPLIMFTPRIMFVFYLILFPAGFFDMHPGHNKMV